MMYELYKTSQCCISKILCRQKVESNSHQLIYGFVSILEYQPISKGILHRQTRNNAAFKNWFESNVSSLFKTNEYMEISKVYAVTQSV